MKKLLLALFLFVSYSTVNAQFSENFDGGTVNMVNSGPGTWTIDNTLSTSAPNSYRGQYTLNSYTSLETPANTIDATGKAFVVLSFKQICKIEFVDSAKIEVSVDGGITWVKLYDHGISNQNCIYLGNSPSFQANESFSESSYGLTWDPGNATTPTNSWWQTETFDISQLAAFQPDIRIRFKSLDVQNIGAARYGWNIDDLNVQLATCELNAPTFGVIIPNLSGTIYSVNPVDIDADILDASGVPQGNAQLFWMINGGPVQEFQPGFGMFDASGSGVGHYFGTISDNGNPFSDGDTICWWIQATDGSGCNNVSFYPPSGQAGCKQFIASTGVRIPYCDSFDNPFPVWHADSTSIGDLWTLGTPANGSLNAAHSGSNVWGIGLTTAYNSSDESYLLSPVFDFSLISVANLTFWLNYNTEGNAFGQYDGARIEYALNSASPVWQVLGNSGGNSQVQNNWYNTANLTSSSLPAWNGNSNGWQKSSYKLGSVAGLPNDPTGVQFRFAFNSDAFGTVEGFLIDDLCILVPPANDLGVTTYLQPIPNAGQAAGSSSPFSVVVENFGTDPQTTFNIGYSITTLGTSSVPYTGTVVAVNSTSNVILPNFVVPSGSFTICTWTDLAGDGDHSNDTLCSTYVGVPTITPTFCDNFENANVNGWNPVNNGASGSDWLLGTPAHANLNTAHSGVNAWDINLSSTYGPNADAELYSPYFDFSAISNGKLSFSYNFNTESSFDGTRLDYSTDGGATWNLLGTGGSTGAPNLAGTDPCGTNWYSKASIFSSTQNAWAGNTTGIWRNASYKLCCTNGILLSPTLVQFRFVFTSDASVQIEGFSIDDFCITSSTGDDAGVSAIISPVVGGFPVGVQAHVVVKIENYGSTILTSIPVTYFAGGVAHSFTYTGSIPACGSVTFAFPDSIGIIQGPNDICAYTQLPGDVNLNNDTTCISVIGQPVITSVYNNSYNDNLESGNIGYAPSIDPLGDAGTIWEFGTPFFALTTGAHTPVNAWDVNLTTATTTNAFTYLTTPYFKLKGNANSQHATLRFWQNRDMAPFTDQFYIEYKKGATGGTWTKLGFNGDINGTNWYNATDNWNGIQGWIRSSYKDIDKLFTSPLPVGDSIIQFRFVYTTGGFSTSNGVSVDDIELYIPIPLSITPLSVNLSIPNSLILPGQPITFAAPIHNDGNNPVFIHNASLVIDNNLVATDFVNYLGSPLEPDSTIIHNFTTTTWIASPGFHQACVYTSSPNGTFDYAMYNDTICSTILVFDSVTTTSLPYCNDFESGTQWVTLDAISYSKATDFELGTPNQTHLNSAHSGSKCWTLYVDSNYINRDSSGLFSSMMRVQTGHCYKLGFWQQFRTEFGSDGGTVEYSDDLGVSWKRIDYTGTPGVISSGAPGTNYSYVIALNPNDPSKKGFTGNANNWFKVEQTIRPNLDGLIIIRWRFASDYSARDEGWSIDDVCFTDLGICTPLGVNEFAIDDFGLSQNYPNPANGNTTIEYMIPHTGSVSIQVTDMIGQVVDVIVSKNESEGKHIIDYNTSKLAPGIYTYTMKFGDRQVTKRMVITE